LKKRVEENPHIHFFAMELEALNGEVLKLMDLLTTRHPSFARLVPAKRNPNNIRKHPYRQGYGPGNQHHYQDPHHPRNVVPEHHKERLPKEPKEHKDVPAHHNVHSDEDKRLTTGLVGFLFLSRTCQHIQHYGFFYDASTKNNCQQHYWEKHDDQLCTQDPHHGLNLEHVLWRAISQAGRVRGLGIYDSNSTFSM
jgi:hypothetical protein